MTRTLGLFAGTVGAVFFAARVFVEPLVQVGFGLMFVAFLLLLSEIGRDD